MSDDEPSVAEAGLMRQKVDNHVDEDTLRIMVSTDNHLGYAEKDPIRGNDSFAAFEEVLVLAKRHNCDCVLLAGDLFHENKPSRLTLHKTMNILRRHTMGPNPVSFQIVSDQKANFRSSVNECVNYEDPYASVDLPIFSIHGNHDDPTRDGGSDMLAALDLLAVSNLVNYFGRQDEVDKVQISPILIHKGNTKVALYGMGSMRDERLNRMWQGKKVRFLRPVSEERDNDEDSDEGDETEHWFNVFALHQNRDLGRGSKNCVHESMIPEWMDLVVWGHEHECLITPSESAVGTFRITQPGSSVATSLSEGEAMRKHVGILDIRGSQFRLLPIPLTQVRSFAVGALTLSEMDLDPMDDSIDDAMTEVLAEHVKKLIKEAREEVRVLNQEASSTSDDDHEDITKELHYRVIQPDQVLVRLKVEHSGFTTLNNSRFGSQFVNEVANPSDILLFHRRRITTIAKNPSNKKGNGKKNNPANISDDEPILPADIEEVQIEDIVTETLAKSDKKLSILEQEKIANAVEDFVSKEIKGILGETVDKIIAKQQRKLVNRGNEENAQVGDTKLTTATAIREVCQAETHSSNRDKDESLPSARKRSRSISDSSVDASLPTVPNPRKAARKNTKSPQSKKSQKVSKSRREDSDGDDDDEHHSSRYKASVSLRRPARTTSRTKNRYEEDDESDEIVDDDSDVELIEVPPPRKRSSRSTQARTKISYQEDSDDEESGVGWGTAGSAR